MSQNFTWPAVQVAIPPGGATSANQATQIGLETSIDSKLSTTNSSLASIDSKLTNPVPVTGPLTDTQLRASAVPVSAASLPLPSGAATAANQTTANASLASIDSKLTAPLSVTGPLTDTQLRASAVPVSAASLPLPTGAATAANQTTANASLSSIDTKLTAPLVTKAGGKAIANAPVRNDYSSVNVTTAAFTQLVASLTTAATEIEIFDSSGQTLQLAIGAPGSEVVQILIFPGGNGRVPLAIAASTRVSIRALSANATVGEIDVNFYA